MNSQDIWRRVVGSGLINISPSNIFPRKYSHKRLGQFSWAVLATISNNGLSQTTLKMQRLTLPLLHVHTITQLLSTIANFGLTDIYMNIFFAILSLNFFRLLQTLVLLTFTWTYFLQYYHPTSFDYCKLWSYWHLHEHIFCNTITQLLSTIANFGLTDIYMNIFLAILSPNFFRLLQTLVLLTFTWTYFLQFPRSPGI